MSLKARVSQIPSNEAYVWDNSDGSDFIQHRSVQAAEQSKYICIRLLYSQVENVGILSIAHCHFVLSLVLKCNSSSYHRLNIAIGILSSPIWKAPCVNQQRIHIGS